MIIKSPYVTEKVTSMIDSDDTLEFLVNTNATKPQIKKALEDLYDVDVLAVRTMIDHLSGTEEGGSEAGRRGQRERVGHKARTAVGVIQWDIESYLKIEAQEVLGIGHPLTGTEQTSST